MRKKELKDTWKTLPFSERTDPFAIIGLRLLNKKLYLENKKLRLENRALCRENHNLYFWNKEYREQRKAEYEGIVASPFDEKVAQEFFERFHRLVVTWDSEDKWYVRYDPKKDSRAFTVRRQHGFTVIYSVARVNNYDTAIASYWIKEEGKPRFRHLDLTSLVDAILKHYELKFYDPITQPEK